MFWVLSPFPISKVSPNVERGSYKMTIWRDDAPHPSGVDRPTSGAQVAVAVGDGVQVTTPPLIGGVQAFKIIIKHGIRRKAILLK